MGESFDIDKVLEALSKKLGTSKENLVKALLEAFLKKSSRIDSIKALKEISEASFFKSSMTIDDIFRYRLMEKLMSDSTDIDFNKVMALVMLRQLFQPDPMTLMLIQRMSESKGGDDQLLRLLMQQQQQQQQMMMTLLTTMFGKRTEELIQGFQQTMSQQQEQLRKETDEKIRAFAETMAREIEELKKDRQELARYFRELAQTVKQQPNAMQILIQAINEYKQLQRALQDAAKELGLKKEEIPVTKEGKVDWGALLNRVLDIAEKYVEIRSQQPQLPMAPSIQAPMQPPSAPAPEAPPMKEIEELPEQPQETVTAPPEEKKEEKKVEVEVKPTIVGEGEGGGGGQE